MMIGRFSLIFVVVTLLFGFASSEAGAAALKVACVGASTTAGDGSTAGHHFPDELRIALGAGYQVQNFGVTGTTALKTGDNPYWKHPALQQALAYQPDIAIFWFGGNDAKPQNWTGHMAEFIADYEEMIRMFQALPSHPKTYLFLSMVIHDVEGIPKTVLEQQVLPEVKQVANDRGSSIINYHDAFITHPEYFPDAVHPNDAGTAAIGKFVAAILLAPSDGGAADVGPGLDASGSAAVPPSSSDDAATAHEAASNATGPPSSSGASGSTGSASAAGASGSAPQANSGSTTVTAGAQSMASPGSSGGGGYGPNGGGGGCAAFGGTPASREMAWIGSALVGLLVLRRVNQRKRRRILYGASVLCAVLPVAACSSGVAPNQGGSMSSSGQEVASSPVVDGAASPISASGSAVGSAAQNGSSGANAGTASLDAGTTSVDSAGASMQNGTDADTSGAAGADALADAAPPSSGPFACSWVLGIHTTQEWFQAGFLNVVDPTRWEASGIESAQFSWQDANSGLWTQAFSSATSCAKNARTPDRIVFCGVDSASTTVAQFLPEYLKVVDNIKTKFPSVRHIDLMTLARAPGDKECIGANRSGSSYIKAAQDDAIAMVVAMYPGFVFSTPKWEVQACSDFGLCPHISLAANMILAKTMGEYFLTH
jgi:lysophospholipase L1-like esterase